MRLAARVAALGCAASAALALAGPAFARYVPRLIVSHDPPNASSSATTISIALTRDDDATAKVTFYVPLGYQGVLGQAAGTQIGTVASMVQANAISPDAIIPINGVIQAADPAQFVTNPQAVACAGPAQHSAVWMLVLTAVGQTLQVPMYVDTVTAGPEAAFAQFRVQVCLPPPATAAQGAKVIEATLTMSNIFTAPSARGQFVWPSLFTPYASNNGPINAAGTVEVRAVVRLPGQLTLNGRITSKKKRTISLGGALTEGAFGIPATPVELLVANRRLLIMRAGANGRYAIALMRSGSKRRVTSSFQTLARVPVRDLTSTACASPTFPPVPCVSATAGAFTVRSRIVRITL
jgi:hypothetical protein